MITCNGTYLGYGLADTGSAYLKTLLQSARIPRRDQLPPIPGDPATPSIKCGPEE
jgi:hypothetical protein